MCYLLLGGPAITAPISSVSLEVSEGEGVVLSCTARGIPRPALIWSPGPDMRRTVTTSETTDIDGFEIVTSNLTISSVQRNEQVYTCLVSSNESRAFTLIVNCK